MRALILLALLALGAAPATPVSEALECRLSYDQAVAAISHLRVQSHEDHPNEDEYRHIRKYDPAQLTAFGFPVSGTSTLKIDAISHEALVVTTGLKAPYAAVRAAALASRGMTACTNPDSDGPSPACNFGEREQDGWTIDFILLGERDTVLSCLYTRPGT